MNAAQGFRDHLRDAALRRDWSSWDAVRLIFADYLADSDDPEEYAARADWRCPWTSNHQGEPVIFKFSVPGLRGVQPLGLKSLRGRYNARPLLGFGSGSLRLLRSFHDRGQGHRYEFSWCPDRDALHFADGTPSNKRWLRPDAGCVRHGFLWLWIPGLELVREKQRADQLLLFPEEPHA